MPSPPTHNGPIYGHFFKPITSILLAKRQEEWRAKRSIEILSGQWYTALLVEDELERKPQTHSTIGIDDE